MRPRAPRSLAVPLVTAEESCASVGRRLLVFTRRARRRRVLRHRLRLRRRARVGSRRLHAALRLPRDCVAAVPRRAPEIRGDMVILKS
eukprot:316068-Prymnesium_polylepis.1